MTWVHWDDEKGFQGIIRHLAPALEQRGTSYLNLLGYRELVTVNPENHIPRFQQLLGSAEFELMADGRVKQTFPNADFSVARVKGALMDLVKQDAGRELSKTDWYIVRSYELNTQLPDDVLSLRKKIRDHVDWVAADIEGKSPRELVEYSWMFPQTDEQVMIQGVPVILRESAPPPVPMTPKLPDDAPTGEGFDPTAHEVWGNADPTVLDPAPEPPDENLPPEPPPTTDGPVPVYIDGEERPDLDANGFPLVTVYAPNVEDTGPRPDSQ